jgi:cysteine desulfurase
MIYLDHAAATPVSDKAIKAMLPYFSERFFNPSAAYLPAVEVRDAYEAAKSDIARAIGAKSADLVMTAGATESINLAFSNILSSDEPRLGAPNVLILSSEHTSVAATADRYGRPAVIKVDKNGLINLKDLESKLSLSVKLVSVALANGELGTIQPLSEIAAVIKKEKDRRRAAGEPTPLAFHSDASQGLCLLDISVARLGVDLLTLNSAKVYGPKGVGALWFNHSVKLKPVVAGGGQELGLRGGTENVPGVIGFAAALTEAKKHIVSERKRLECLKKIFKDALIEESAADPNAFSLFALGSPKTQLASFLPLVFPGLDAERLVFKLEQKGVLVSTGAACAASKGEKSRTLVAIGLSDAEIAGSLRITLGKLNNEENIREAARLIAEAAREDYR